MEIIDKIVKSQTPPSRTDVLWYNGDTLAAYRKNKWMVLNEDFDSIVNTPDYKENYNIIEVTDNKNLDEYEIDWSKTYSVKYAVSKDSEYSYTLKARTTSFIIKEGIYLYSSALVNGASLGPEEDITMLDYDIDALNEIVHSRSSKYSIITYDLVEAHDDTKVTLNKAITITA